MEEYLDFLYAKFRNNLSHNRKSDFNPEEYRGVLSHLDIDLEKELSEMRNQWKHYI
ncbi:MAG: hypothetical protein K9G67_13455 [Bacteroidales bacterium]|nr:hypothetical protein [Bacteroidales bacterium]MCF8351790.1 hypothetical protein [Bacteroidales bacterium]MCF8377358.1 hypothetical protein [Bacteroidales bacterium]MCF8401381.1 hypothetical protein [Bacteroidales bacterium]